MSETSDKAVEPEIEKIVAKNITSEEGVSTSPLTKVTEVKDVEVEKKVPEFKEVEEAMKVPEVKEVVEVKKVPELKEVVEVKEVADIVESDTKKVAEVTENVTEEPAVSLTPNPIDLKQLGLTASDDNGLADVIDDFDNALSLKSNEQNGTNSMNELQQIQSVQSHLSAGILFSDPRLNIPRPILDALTLEMRFDKPSAIQATTIPLILKGVNLIAQAQAGAGKTIAFTIGMLSRIDTSRDSVQALCLTPTRELAQQIISDAVLRLSTRIPHLRCEPALPGYDIERGSRCTSHIVVGTPGTVKKWLAFRYLELSTVKVFVLDEADAMVAKSQQAKSLGADTLAIKKMLSPNCQILFFSATYTKEIIDFSRRLVSRAHEVTLKSDEDLILDVVFQVCMNVNLLSNKGGKLQVLQDIYDFMAIKQSIVFVEMRREADRVASMMREKGFEVSVLHGELQGVDRDHVMNDFRQGISKVLITTNALARGVDVPSVAVVVNYDLPTERMGQTRVSADTATYVHRIGRCSRFGRKGMVINFLETQQDAEIMSEIEMYYSPKHRMTTDWDPNDIEGLKDAIDNRKTAPSASGSS